MKVQQSGMVQCIYEAVGTCGCWDIRMDILIFTQG